MNKVCDKVCGTCEWHEPEDDRMMDSSISFLNISYFCNYEWSRYYTEYTDYGHTCEDWTERED